MGFSTSLAAESMLGVINKASSSSPSTNVVVSPMSITLILSMLANGSNGETLDQFLKVLGSKGIEQVNTKSKNIMSLLAASGDGGNSENTPQPPPRPSIRDNGISRHDHPPLKMPQEPANKGKDPVFRLVNALWVDQGYSLTSSFKEITDSIYKASVKSVDLCKKSGEVVKEVNYSWAEKETNGLIKNFLSENTELRPPLCLANAVHFKGAWKTPFKASNTRDDDFHLLDGDTKKVPFMTNRYETYFYASFRDFKLLRLQYKKSAGNNNLRRRMFSMYIFLPHARDGLRSLLAAELCRSDPAALPLGREVELEHVRVPKFKFSFVLDDCVGLMEARGLTLPFDREGADFSNMARGGGGDNLYVGMFLHKAFIEVNEEGTDAAAVTFSEVDEGCPAPRGPPPSFVADHPFMFMIVDDSSNLVVFTGAVLDPSLSD